MLRSQIGQSRTFFGGVGTGVESDRNRIVFSNAVLSVSNQLILYDA